MTVPHAYAQGMDRSEETPKRVDPHQGLKDLVALLPEGSTLEDAYRFRKASFQRLRQPCSFLDRELGIVR